MNIYREHFCEIYKRIFKREYLNKIITIKIIRNIRGDMMEVLGYQLIKIDKTTYDASVLAKYEKLEDILLACEEKGLDIIYFNEGQLILESIEEES